jgi:hypothetical protein
MVGNRGAAVKKPAAKKAPARRRGGG